jgi:glycosyltransferase involved in cell wall biosynthesis
MLARQDHDVWVLTRTAYRSNIEKELLHSDLTRKLNFIYYDKENIANLMHRLLGKLHLYYYIWQIGAYFAAKKAHQREVFELVHHATWVSARLPSFMGNLGIPFIFGPIAGGESAPLNLRVGYGLRTWIGEGIRDISNWLVKFDPMMRLTFAQASRIYVTSHQTKTMVPKSFHNKTRIQLAIAADECDATNEESNIKSIENTKTEAPLKLIYVGRFLEWKGMHLGFPAFAQFLKEQPLARLTLVGTGPAEKKWKQMAESLGISHSIDWIPWVERSKLSDFYKSHDVFLFPSLHDSGGMVVLEAMSNGLPIVCLDIGGPSILVNSSCGFSIQAIAETKEKVINSLSVALSSLKNNNVRRNLSQGARMRVKQFTWSELVTKVYDEY